MNVKVEKTENKDEVKLEITVDANVFVEGMKKVYEENKSYFSVPGFRKGKVPMALVEKQYGAAIFYEDAFQDVASAAYDQAIKDEKIEVFSKPATDIVQMEKGKDLIFTCVVATKPEVKLGKYKGIELTKNDTKVSDKDVDEEINRMAEQNSRLVSVSDREAQKGDTSVIDFLGTVDGVPFEGGKSENYSLELGSNTFIPGFEDQVIGMKIGENKDIKVKFPEDYFSEELKGKEANFNVTLHELKYKELPTIDDEFAKDVSEFDTLKELKESIKSKKEKENEDNAQAQLEENAIREVAKNSEVNITDAMVDLELDNMQEDMNRRLSAQGFSFEQYLKMLGKTMADFRAESKEPATDSLKMRLVLEALCEDAKIEATEKEIDEKIEELAKAYSRTAEELKANEALVESVINNIKSEKGIKLVVDNAKVSGEAKKTTKKAETEKAEKTEKTEKKTTTKKTTKK